MTDAFRVVREFEYELAKFARAEYAVAVESCTAAIFLSCMYCKVQGKSVYVPKHTYPSVPASVIHAGGKVIWTDEAWKGIYQLKPFLIIDGAKRFHEGMYVPGTLHCLSFHAKKKLPIGRGGAILTNSEAAYKWLKLARFDGREEGSLQSQKDITVLGWNMYMTPEQAARGMLLLQLWNGPDEDQLEEPPYPDLSKFKAFRQ